MRIRKFRENILENNKFEKTYSDVMWQKMKTGTGAYKVMWDPQLLNGLGDIRIERVNLLNLYWEPGITDIQKSRYFFQTELAEKEVLVQLYPFLEGKLQSSGPFSSRFLYDDAVAASDYAMDVYFTTDPTGIHPNENGHKALAPYFYNALLQELALKV